MRHLGDTITGGDAMGFYEHLNFFDGRPVVNFVDQTYIDPATAYRVTMTWADYDRPDGGNFLIERLGKLLDTTGSVELRSLVIGVWGFEMNSVADVHAFLIANASRMPKLEGLMIGDIIQEESEASWIEQGPTTAVAHAFPALQRLHVRGGNHLRFEGLHHPRLRTLIVESGGLSKTTIQDILDADLPALEDLELWLGDDGYGFDATIDQLAPLWDVGRWPELKRLGLCNSVIADELAIALADADILEQLDVLDLSRGQLKDAGGTALLNSSKVKTLRHLNLQFHFMSEPVYQALAALPLDVDVSDVQEPDAWGGELYYYIAVSE